MRSGIFLAGLCLLAACSAPQAEPPAAGAVRLADTCVDIGLDQG